MERARSRVIRDYKKLKKIAESYARKGNPEYALRTIYFACGFMFHMNQLLWDEELESLLEAIVKRHIKPAGRWETKAYNCLFYDSFGRVDRGMARIYLTALADLGYHVTYATHEKNRASKEQIRSLMGAGSIRFVKGMNFLDQMRSLLEIIKESKASICLMHLMPEDIVAAGAFLYCKDVVKRYQINLTDHAFWVGKNISDIVINFREFGAKVCAAYRGIPQNQNAFLPYYPDSPSMPFSGFDGLKGVKPVIFSGGNLYKTQSSDDRYYYMLERIFQELDVNIVYFGNGHAKKIRALCRKYPDRIFFSRERQDYFEAMKRSICYLSTYPYNGGLMTQHALLAGKVPVTLRAEGIEEELTIHPEQAFWNYDTVEECVEMIRKLLTDTAYRKEMEQSLSYFLVDKGQFTEELGYLLKNSRSVRQVNGTGADVSGFMEHPLWYYRGIRYNRLFFRRNGFFFLWHFPIRYLTGAVGRIFEKLYHGIYIR